MLISGSEVIFAANVEYLYGIVLTRVVLAMRPYWGSTTV